jgi:hypothetical protein
MTTMIFDTLAYSKKLKEAGFTELQAEVQAEALAELIDDKLATKQDIVLLKKDIDTMVLELSNKLTIRMGSIAVLSLTALALIIKL